MQDTGSARAGHTNALIRKKSEIVERISPVERMDELQAKEFTGGAESAMQAGQSEESTRLTRRKACSAVAAAAALVLLGSPALHADVLVVSPGAQTASEGNTDNILPFSTAPVRYQQVYGAASFSSLSGPAEITDILFRPDSVFGNSFSSILPNVQIDLSTTTAQPDALSPTFALNVGGNDTVVYSGPLALSSANSGPAAGPKTFDIDIHLMTPFLYDPAAGNLLLDVRNFGGGITTSFDAHLATDEVSRVFSTTGAGAATGSTDSLGLVTEFRFASGIAAVPEPSSWILLISGAFAAACRLRRQRSV